MTPDQPHPTDTVATVAALLARLGRKASASWHVKATTKPTTCNDSLSLTCNKLSARLRGGYALATKSAADSPEQQLLDALAKEGLPQIQSSAEALLGFFGATKVQLEGTLVHVPKRAQPLRTARPAPIDIGAVVAAAAARTGIRPEDIGQIDLHVKRSGATRRHYPTCYVPRIGTLARTRQITAALEAELLPWVDANIEWLSLLRRIDIEWHEIAVTGHARMRAAAAARQAPENHELSIDAQRRIDAFLKRIVDLSNRYGVVIEPDPAGGARLVPHEPNTLRGIYAFDTADGRFLGLKPLKGSHD